MKKTIMIMAGIVLSLLTVSAYAQEPVQNTWDPKKNPTVDSITSKYEGKLIPPRAPLTTEQIFPVLGQYQSTANADAANVSISLDADNKGLVWIEGLPQGRVKAMLRKSPATYKIPAQKTEDGKEVAEGTLIFDQETNTLNIVIGKPFKSDDPGSVFAPATATEQPVEEVKVKTKSGVTKTKTKVKAGPKPWTYTGTKVETGTTMMQ